MTTEGTERRSEGLRPRPHDRLLLPCPPHASHDPTIIDPQTQLQNQTRDLYPALALVLLELVFRTKSIAVRGINVERT